MLVTLTGGAGSGKTTLAAALAATAPEGPVRVLHADDYYFRTPEQGVWAPDESGVPRLDVGDPRSLDFVRLARDTDAALGDWALVVVDGMFARRVTPRTTSPRTAIRRFDIFVDLPADLRLARKIQRKCLRDGFPLDVLLRNYLDHRRSAHEQHVEPLRGDCDLVLDADRPVGDLARQVWEAIDDHGAAALA